MSSLSELLESNICSVLLETLPAHVQTVLSDDAVRVSAHSARSAAGTVFTGVGEPNIVVTHLDVLRLREREGLVSDVQKVQTVLEIKKVTLK